MANQSFQVLLVEDNRAEALLLKQSLRELDGVSYNVRHALRLEEAVHYLRNTPFDVVLLDLDLPDSMGLDTILTIRKQFPSVPIIALTPLNSNGLSVQAIQTGAQDYVHKDQADLLTLPRVIRYAIERAKFRERLLESEFHFRTLADSGLALIWTSGPDKKCDYFNQPWLDFTGRTLSQELGDGWVAGVHADDLERCVEIYTTSFDRHERFSMVYRIRHHSGEYRWIQDDGSPRYNSHGEFIGYIGHCLDITERKKAEEALAKSEKRFRQLFDESPVGYHEIDDQGRIVEVNRTELEMLGYTSEEMLGKPIWEFILECEFSRCEITGKISGTKPSGESFERTFRRKNGTTIPVLIKERAYRNESGEIIRLRGTVQDISARKRAEATLSQLSTAVEQSPASIVITDLKGNIEYANPKFEQVSGYTFAEVVGKNPRILKSGKTTPVEYKEMYATLLAGKEWRGEFHNRKKNGELYWESASISPIIGPGGTITHFLAVKEDITQNKMMAEKMRQAQKMESIGTLAGGIAHDFNNILGIIIGHAGLLRDNAKARQNFNKSLSAVESAAQRGASLVRQILTFARKSDVQFEFVRINDVVKELSTMLYATFPKSITFEVDMGPQLPLIDGDATQLHQTLLNLCVNARDAMPNGGTLSITTGTVTGNELRKSFPNASKDDYLQVTLRDTGTGMSDEVREKIFEPFFTTKGLGEGTGLGLAVVYGIVSDHHGFIDVDSTPGEGTVFQLYFPIPDGSPKQPACKSERTQIEPGKNETILLVEDEDLLRTAITTILTSHGYRVLAARDGMEAVEEFKNANGSVALVLMDYGLPRLCGLDALKQIKNIRPETKCIMSSGHLDEKVREELGDITFTELLSKPYQQEDILVLVRNVLNGKNGNAELH